MFHRLRVRLRVAAAPILGPVPPDDHVDRLLRWPDPPGPVADMRLVIDVGMNDGRDTLFYLKKGFRVVAVEANPVLAEKGRALLQPYLDSGQLAIEAVGLGETEGELPFYANLDNDHWSSFDRTYGTRQGTRYETLAVRCVRPQALFQKYGMPYYLKIDIEGGDTAVVRALHDFAARPRYVSMEEAGAESLADLWAAGCRTFKLVNQWALFRVRCPNPPREGVYVDAAFNGFASGPFGDEAGGEWVDFGRAVERYLTEVRSPTRGYLAGHAWYDVHGRFD